jgi:hypothetical protein
MGEKELKKKEKKKKTNRPPRSPTHLFFFLRGPNQRSPNNQPAR